MQWALTVPRALQRLHGVQRLVFSMGCRHQSLPSVPSVVMLVSLKDEARRWVAQNASSPTLGGTLRLCFLLSGDCPPGAQGQGASGTRWSQIGLDGLRSESHAERHMLNQCARTEIARPHPELTCSGEKLLP